MNAHLCVCVCACVLPAGHPIAKHHPLVHKKVKLSLSLSVLRLLVPPESEKQSTYKRGEGVNKKKKKSTRWSTGTSRNNSKEGESGKAIH